MKFNRWATLLIILGLGSAFANANHQTDLPETVKPVIDEAPTKAHSYDWMARHQAVVDRVKKGNVDMLLVGDSITHMWGGDPQPGGPGQFLWDKYFGSRNAVNLGFGWDRTQHVIWRLQNGEIDGIHPKLAIVMIGTNNMGSNSSDDIATGVDTIVHTLRKKMPRMKILLLGIFPRDHNADTPMRKQIMEVNDRISVLGKERNITYLDLGSIFKQPDGTISSDIMGDYLHPTPKGFQMWAEAMEPTVAKLFGDKPRDPSPLPSGKS